MLKMKFDFRYEGFSNNFIVSCFATFERLGNTGLGSKMCANVFCKCDTSVLLALQSVFRNKMVCTTRKQKTLAIEIFTFLGGWWVFFWKFLLF